MLSGQVQTFVKKTLVQKARRVGAAAPQTPSAQEADTARSQNGILPSASLISCALDDSAGAGMSSADRAAAAAAPAALSPAVNCGKTSAAVKPGTIESQGHAVHCTAQDAPAAAAEGEAPAPTEWPCQGCGQVCDSLSSVSQHKRLCQAQWVLLLAAQSADQKNAAVAGLSVEERPVAIAAFEKAVELAAMSPETRLKALTALEEQEEELSVAKEDSQSVCSKRDAELLDSKPLPTWTVDELRGKCKELGIPHMCRPGEELGTGQFL